MNLFTLYAPAAAATDREMTTEEIARDNAEWQRWMNTETVGDRHPEKY